MKKQVRIFIFAALLVLLLGVTVLAVSAAGEFSVYPSAADAEAGTNKVGDYDTLTLAGNQIAGNGYVIKMTADVTTDTQNYQIDKAYTYTIDGDGHTLQVNTNTSSYVLSIGAGNVTIKDLTIYRMTGDGSQWSTGGYHLRVQSTPTIIVEDTVMKGGDSCFDKISTTATLIFRGASTCCEQFDTYLGEVTNGSRGGLVKFENGSFQAGVTRGDRTRLGKMSIMLCAGAKIWITGGTFTFVGIDGTKKVDWLFRLSDGDWVSPILIEGGTFNVHTGGAVIKAYDGNTDKGFAQHYEAIDSDPNVVVKITGGTFDIGGNGKVLHTSITANTAYVQGTNVGAKASGKPVFLVTNCTFQSTVAAASNVHFWHAQSKSSSYQAVLKITGGTFTASTSGTNRMFMPEMGNDILEVTGGTFSNNNNASAILLYADYNSTYSDTQGVFNIKGGTWDGSTGTWFGGYGNAIVNLGDPEDPSSTYPRFSGNISGSAPIGLWNKHAGYYKAVSGRLNIYSGTYTYTATGDQPMIAGQGGSVLIAGGTLTTSSSYIFYCGDRDIMSPIRVTGGDLTVTKSGSVIIFYNYHNKDAADGSNAGKDVCGQVRDASWAYGNTIIKIDGGNFHVNASDACAIETCFNVVGHQATALENYPDGILDRNDTVYVEITGGTFTTSTNTIDSFIRDGRADKGRYTTAENGVNPTLSVHYSISGTASFTGGCAWIRLRDNGVFNISGGTFHSGATFVGDTRYIWIQNPSVNGGAVNISGGTFTETTGKRMFNAAGADITISGGTFTAKTNLLNMSDGDMVSNVTITGGTFRSTGTDSTLYFNAGDSSQSWHEGTLRITGGTFTADNSATYSLKYTTTQTSSNYCYIEGGTFDGKIQSTVTAAGHKLLITGGSFKADSGFEAYVPGRGLVGVATVSSYEVVTAANLHGFVGSQMRIGTDLGVYFYVLKINATDTGTPSLVVSDEEGTLATLTEYATPANYPDGTAVESGYTLYCFTFNGLPPQRMGDDLDVVFKLTGVAKFANEFSVLRYCRQVRAAYPTADMLSVTGALLNFGAAAQTYSGYHADALVNATASDVSGAGTFSAVAQTKAHYSSASGTAHFIESEEDGVAARGVRFDTGIQLYVRVVDTAGTATCTYSVAGGSPVACEKVDLGGNRYIFYTDALSLDDFESNVTFTLSTGQTCTYSVQAFVYYYQDHATDDAGKALARALWAYKTAVTGVAAMNDWAGFDIADVVNP